MANEHEKALMVIFLGCIKGIDLNSMEREAKDGDSPFIISLRVKSSIVW